MSDDFAERVARRRLAEIEAGRAGANYQWMSAKAENDEYTAIEAYQRISDFNKEEAQLRRDYDQHVASQQPQAPIPQSPEELRVKPAEKMTWQDGLDVAINGSKYGKGLDFNDPNVRRGYAEVMRKRQAGENQS
jgi:hypothetical protein